MENRKNFDVYFAFGIASLVLAILSLIVPGIGIIITGISGFMAWISIGKGFPYGAAAVILNLINIFSYLPVTFWSSRLKNPSGLLNKLIFPTRGKLFFSYK